MKLNRNFTASSQFLTPLNSGLYVRTCKIYSSYLSLPELAEGNAGGHFYFKPSHMNEQPTPTMWCTISQQEITDLSRCKKCLESKADGSCDHLIDLSKTNNTDYAITESNPAEGEDTPRP